VEHPDQYEAALRALCLGALVMRSKFESIVQSASPQMIAVHEELSTQLNMWLADEGLIAWQSTQEKPVVCKALGSLTRQELVETSWRADALGVILWALGIFENLLPWDTRYTPQETIKPLNLFAPTGAFLGEVRLRPAAEIEAARELAELWHWRAQVKRPLKEELELQDVGEVAAKVRAAAGKAYANGDIPEPVGGDFPVYGKAYAELEPEEYSEVAAIAIERHHALNWLCGFSKDWDAVPIETPSL